MGEYSPDPFNSNNSMKFSICRLTSSSGGVASAAYTSIVSEVRVTGGCVGPPLCDTLCDTQWQTEIYMHGVCLGMSSLLVGGDGGLVIDGRGAVSPAYQYCNLSQHLPLTCIEGCMLLLLLWWWWWWSVTSAVV